MVMTVPLFGLPVGPEILVIVLIVILLFGANKIPELARSTGEAMGEFQKGREEAEQELQEMLSELDPTQEGPSESEASTETGTTTDGGTASESQVETETEPTE
jgi:sec-independent protein translocase protein TatA